MAQGLATAGARATELDAAQSALAEGQLELKQARPFEPHSKVDV
jgi:hypothetical protein